MLFSDQAPEPLSVAPSRVGGRNESPLPALCLFSASACFRRVVRSAMEVASEQGSCTPAGVACRTTRSATEFVELCCLGPCACVDAVTLLGTHDRLSHHVAYSCPPAAAKHASLEHTPLRARPTLVAAETSGARDQQAQGHVKPHQQGQMRLGESRQRTACL